jgi:hypothetical protein
MTEPNTSEGKVTVATDKSRLRLLRLIGVFLLLQALGLVSLCIYLITGQDWEALELPRGRPFIPPNVGGDKGGAEKIEALLTPYLEAIYSSSLFIPLAILIVLAAISFLLLRQMGWLLAMLMEGLTLMACLTLYFWGKPFFVYPIMLYCIVMVLYLNSYDVRLTYLSKSSQEKKLINN